MKPEISNDPITLRSAGKRRTAILSLVFGLVAIACGLMLFPLYRYLAGLPLLIGILSLLLCVSFWYVSLHGMRRRRGISGSVGLAWIGVLGGVAILFFSLASFLEAKQAIVGHHQGARTAMKFLGVGFQAYAQDHDGRLPPAASVDEHGRPLLSWRVLLLPYLGEEALYREFHLDEPWDSPHNIKLSERMPEVYQPVKGVQWVEQPPPPYHTFYQVVVGPGTAFEPGVKGVSIEDFPDGASSTILFVVAEKPVPWTKPADVKYVPRGPLPALRHVPYHPNRFLDFNPQDDFIHLIAFADGSCSSFRPSAMTGVDWCAAFSRSRGERFDPSK